MDHYHAIFETGNFYHIYNRGNNSETIFFNDRNYLYFLEKWGKYFSKYLDIYSYCLIPNHFHFFAQVKEFDISDAIAQSEKKTMPSLKAMASLNIVNSVISEQFRRFFITYSQAINKQENRTGSLFHKPFKRIHVDSDDYITSIINYIHHNPIHHGLVKNYHDWSYCSYNEILNNVKTKINRDFVLQWFGSRDEFIKFHKGLLNYKTIEKYIMED